MDRYGASSHHYDSDSASDTGYDYYPRSSGPSRRSLRAHHGPTLGHEGGARGADAFDSDDENDFDFCELHIYDGPANGARGADLFSSDDDSEIEPRRPRHVYGRGRAGARNRDGPPVVVRLNRATDSDPASFVRGFSFSDDEVIDDDDQESECEHHAARGGGRRLGMRFDTDTSDESGADRLSRGSYGHGGRGSTAPYPPRRGPAPRDRSSGESVAERHVASSRRGRGTAGAGSRGGVMTTPTPPLRSSRGCAQGARRGGGRH